MMPWTHSRSLSRYGGDDVGFPAIEERMSRLIDEFFHDWGQEPWAGSQRTRMVTPCIDVLEREKEFVVSAELPGMECKDIDLTFSHNTLTLCGEKKCECEEGKEETGYYRRERSYGCFQRTVVLPTEIDVDHADAHFANGILTVTLPKTPEEVESSKHIEIKGE